MNKVLLALSGGVDSSVSAELLKHMGYEVAGVVMMMSDAHEKTLQAARDSAKALGIRLFELDLRREFKSEIIDYFADEYLNGRTPCPCVRCNPKIKFKYLLKTALENGCDYIATGHYANIVFEDGVYKLKRAKSAARDQSYMLAGLGQDVLSRLILPLADIEKDEVRAIADKLGLPCRNAPDSQENCFIPDNDYALYIESNYRSAPEGNFISPEGEICGRHKGIIHYTVGQRKGLGIALGRPAFVSEINAERNEIRLSYEKSVTDEVMLGNVSEVFSGAVKDGGRYSCKLRSVGKLLGCRANLLDGGNVLLKLDSPEPRVSAGQAGVIYDGDTVLGMGTIQ